jgi:triphosphatase
MITKDRAARGASVEPRADAEVELKLHADPEVLKALFAGPAIHARATGRGSAGRLENVYYDTPDQRLRAAGLAFRVRKDGGRHLQTLKSNGPGGVVAHRAEWEVRLPSAEPDLRLLPAGATEALNGLPVFDGLSPLFTIRVRRASRRVQVAGRDGQPNLVEAALDLGAIEAGGRSQVIAEIELELLEGAPTALYDLALELDELSPLRIETQSKSARGYALARGEAPAVAKAAPLALGADIAVDEAIGSILRACLQHWCANQAAAVDGRDPEGVHQMRVALRRLRSAVSVFGHLILPGRRAWLDAESERIIGGLGAARDWDVFLTEALAPVVAARPQDGRLGALREVAETARDEGYARARAMVGSPPYTRFLLQLGRWIEAEGWRDDASAKGAAWLERPVAAFADRLLGRRHRKALKLGQDFAGLAPEERHRLRIALKKLRYATEFFRSAYKPKRTARYLAALKGLQDALGHLNDVAVAERLTGSLLARADGDRLALAQASGMVLGWLARGVAELEPQTRSAWDDFTARKPFWG